MKKILLLSFMLCVAHTGFAQVKVNSGGNTGMGVSPNSKTKLLLNNSLAADPADANTEEMILYQNAPNPFHENTTIQCYIPQMVNKVQLCVYDMQGVQVKCLLVSERGTVTVQIQAGQLTAGIYTYLLIGDGKASEAKQMILTK